MQAIVLAKERWATHAFDLAPETWETLFQDHHPGDVLQAISKTRSTRDPRPEKVFEGLIYWINRFEAERTRINPTWPDFSATCRQI